MWSCIVLKNSQLVYRIVQSLFDVNKLLWSCFISTYKAVKLVPRPWKTPEGTVNHVSLKTLLTGVMMHIMENPGVTGDMLVQKYAHYLQPVPLFELIEVLFCGSVCVRTAHVNVLLIVHTCSTQYSTEQFQLSTVLSSRKSSQLRCCLSQESKDAYKMTPGWHHSCCINHM